MANTQTIAATVETDNGKMEVDFDAAPYFVTATLDDLTKLAKCEWGGDYPADEVVAYFRNTNPEIGQLFDYAEKHDEGFECYIDRDEAISWLQANRPDVVDAVLAAE